MTRRELARSAEYIVQHEYDLPWSFALRHNGIRDDLGVVEYQHDCWFVARARPDQVNFSRVARHQRKWNASGWDDEIGRAI